MYKIINEKMIKRLSDGAFFKIDANSPDGDEYRKWLSDGNTPQAADEIPPAKKMIDADILVKILKKKGQITDQDLAAEGL